MRLLACLIVAPQRGYDEPAILSYAISSFCPTSADGLQFDHRYNTYEGLLTKAMFRIKAAALPFGERCLNPVPRFWLPKSVVDERLKENRDRQWLLVWRDITNATTNRRTVVACMLPRVATDFTLRVAFLRDEAPSAAAFLLANLNSFMFDYVCRQFMGGNHLSDYIMKQLPAFPPASYAQSAAWSPKQTIGDLTLPRVLELTYTAWDLEP